MCHIKIHLNILLKKQYCLSIMEGTQPTQPLTCLQESLVEWQISFAPYYSPLNMLFLINSWLTIVTEWLEFLLLIQEMPSPNLHPWDLLPWLQTIMVILQPHPTNTTPILQIWPIHFLPHIFPILYLLTIISFNATVWAPESIP